MTCKISFRVLVIVAVLGTACAVGTSRKKSNGNQSNGGAAAAPDFCTPGASNDSSGYRPDVVGGPRIEFDATSHDFGTALAGPSLQHFFGLRNSGDATLVIDEMLVSCGCTSAVARDTQIPPGGRTLIEVGFYTRPFLGPVRETITVHSNDPRRPTVTLEISAVVERQRDN
jgi:hypothetical protein